MSESWAEARAERRRTARVVHLWRCGNLLASETWCGAREFPRGVRDDELEQVTCESCLGMAATFGGAALSRLREITEPAVACLARDPDPHHLERGGSRAVGAPVASSALCGYAEHNSDCDCGGVGGPR